MTLIWADDVWKILIWASHDMSWADIWRWTRACFCVTRDPWQPAKLFSILQCSVHSNIGARDEPGRHCQLPPIKILSSIHLSQSEPGIMSHVLPRYWYYDLSSINMDPIFICDVHKNLVFIWYIFFDKNFSPALSQINTTSLCSHIPKF